MSEDVSMEAARRRFYEVMLETSKRGEAVRGAIRKDVRAKFPAADAESVAAQERKLIERQIIPDDIRSFEAEYERRRLEAVIDMLKAYVRPDNRPVEIPPHNPHPAAGPGAKLLNGEARPSVDDTEQARPAKAFPLEAALYLIEQLDELKAGIIPFAWRVLLHEKQGQRDHPREVEAKRRGVLYVKAAKAALLSDKHPVKTVAGCFSVDRNTVRRWLKSTALDGLAFEETLDIVHSQVAHLLPDTCDRGGFKKMLKALEKRHAAVMRFARRWDVDARSVLREIDDALSSMVENAGREYCAFKKHRNWYLKSAALVTEAETRADPKWRP